MTDNLKLLIRVLTFPIWLPFMIVFTVFAFCLEKGFDFLDWVSE